MGDQVLETEALNLNFNLLGGVKFHFVSEMHNKVKIKKLLDVR